MCAPVVLARAIGRFSQTVLSNHDTFIQVALTDSQYMLVIRGIAVKNMLSRVGLAKGTHASEPSLIRTDRPIDQTVDQPSN